MATPTLEPAFTLGEVSPALFGRFDLARIHVAAATMRNMWPSYRGGAYSRAGTAFVGFSKQTGRSVPPRLIPFQFSINQGIALEFGNFYMRVISNGGFVTEAPFAITGITNTKPAVVSINPLSTGISATSIPSSVTATYVPGDTITLAGGTFTVAAVLSVLSTTVSSLALNVAATSGYYAPGDIVTLAGGTQTAGPIIQVATTQVVSATIAHAHTSAGNGVYTATGTTGTGTRFKANVTVAGNRVTSVNSITVAGNYTVNPTVPFYEPINILGDTQAALTLTMGILTFSVQQGGDFTVNAPGAALTQASTNGHGIGATFNNVVFAPNRTSFANPGSYTIVPNNPVGQSATSGTGVGASFNVTWLIPGNLSNNDWMFISGVAGMTQVNNQTFVIQGVGAGSFQLYDVYGNPIDASGFGVYTGGGTAARIYTLTTQYAEADLEYLKFTQSADVMSLCCVNQITNVEYPPLDLSRLGNTNWQFSPVVPTPSVSPPPAAPLLSASTGGSAAYAYAITAVSPTDGSESIASGIGTITGAVNVTATAGSITLTWSPSPTAGVNVYNVYKATPTLSGTPPPAGSLLGFAGQAYGNQFVDTNIVADLAQVPPTHQNPFARGQIIDAQTTTPGAGYTTATAIINTSTGTGAVLVPVIVGTGIVAWITDDPGQNYAPTDTMTITGDGAGAAATLIVGAESGTYPGTVTYFQERRAYAYTLNNTDTYFMSQPGAFTNFDTRIPTIDSDAITGSPWSLEVNGIQFMVPTAGGLLIFTGLSCWLLVGAGSFATNVQAISPASQLANPQPAIGCSPTLQPIKINYDVIFSGSKNSFYYDLPYQLYALSEPIDLTVNSAHLFTNYTFREHAWTEQPNKLMWAVRNDGVMLSLTFLKAEQVASWARHDTFGLWESVASVTEPPVDALYLAAQRTIGTNTAFTIERMDDQLWQTVEQTWCVDCGFSLPQNSPNATLTASSPTGLGAVTGATGLVGGLGYSAGTFGFVVDAPLTLYGLPGPGVGAVPTLTIIGGVITAVTFAPGSQGAGYLNPQLVISDPAGSNGGSGGSAVLTLSNAATFTASANVFSAGNIGSVIRMGGGKAVITAFTDAQHVTVNITDPIAQLVPNAAIATAQAAPAGQWTLSAPVSSVFLPQLAGATVTGLADGNVIPPAVVPANGVLVLPLPASQVTVGFGFQAQFQSIYLDVGEGQGTVQAQRKKIAAANVLLQASRGVKMGSDQIDGSTQSPIQIAPVWQNLDNVPDLAPLPYNSVTRPLFTGYQRIPVQGGFQKPGQVCLQQDNPLPMNVLSLVPEFLEGDTPSQNVPQKQKAA